MESLPEVARELAGTIESRRVEPGECREDLGAAGLGTDRVDGNVLAREEKEVEGLEPRVVVWRIFFAGGRTETGRVAGPVGTDGTNLQPSDPLY